MEGVGPGVHLFVGSTHVRAINRFTHLYAWKDFIGRKIQLVTWENTLIVLNKCIKNLGKHQIGNCRVIWNCFIQKTNKTEVKKATKLKLLPIFFFLQFLACTLWRFFSQANFRFPISFGSPWRSLGVLAQPSSYTMVKSLRILQRACEETYSDVMISWWKCVGVCPLGSNGL